MGHIGGQNLFFFHAWLIHSTFMRTSSVKSLKKSTFDLKCSHTQICEGWTSSTALVYCAANSWLSMHCNQSVGFQVQLGGFLCVHFAGDWLRADFGVSRVVTSMTPWLLKRRDKATKVEPNVSAPTVPPDLFSYVIPPNSTSPTVL